MGAHAPLKPADRLKPDQQDPSDAPSLTAFQGTPERCLPGIERREETARSGIFAGFSVESAGNAAKSQRRESENAPISIRNTHNGIMAPTPYHPWISASLYVSPLYQQPPQFPPCPCVWRGCVAMPPIYARRTWPCCFLPIAGFILNTPEQGRGRLPGLFLYGGP